MSAADNVSLNRKVLLFDLDHRRRDIRAGNLRLRGVDVLSARNIEELQEFWQLQTFRLVLIELAIVLRLSASVKKFGPMILVRGLPSLSASQSTWRSCLLPTTPRRRSLR